MSTFYYIFPFGIDADDLAAIPSPSAIDGSVSYENGWTPPYEYDLNTNPAALPIPRGQMNQLFFDITNNLQEYQQYGTPNWITASDNGGTSFPYPIYARVYYMGQVYENQVAANTATPGADDTWLLLSGDAQGVPIGTVIDYAGAIAPTGYLTCDGSQVSRATYSELLVKLLITQTGTLTNTTPTITGLSDTSNLYPGMAIEAANIPSGAQILTVDSSSQVTMTANATGGATESIFFYLWGNGDNSTTFNLPDLRRKTSVGKFGTGSSTLGNKTGQTGGSETQTLLQNQLPASIVVNTATTTLTDLGGTGGETLIGVTGTGNTNLTLTNAGGNQSVSIVQPSAVMNKCIKF